VLAAARAGAARTNNAAASLSKTQTHKLNPQRYNPIKTIKTSFLGTMNMLGLARRVRARFLLTSTSEVYGDPLQHPQTEAYWGNVNPIGERSCYDEGKRAAECLTMDYHREHGIEVLRVMGGWSGVVAMGRSGVLLLHDSGFAPTLDTTAKPSTHTNHPPSPSTIKHTQKTKNRCASCASSTRTARAWRSTTAASCPTLSRRR
jgi:hypothetical protein